MSDPCPHSHHGYCAESDTLRAEVERLRRALLNIPGLVAKHTGGVVTNWIASNLDDVVEAVLAGEPMPEDWV